MSSVDHALPHSEYGGADLGTHSPSDDEELNVTGGLFAIAHGLNRIADAITQYSADETVRRDGQRAWWK